MVELIGCGVAAGILVGLVGLTTRGDTTEVAVAAGEGLLDRDTESLEDVQPIFLSLSRSL